MVRVAEPWPHPVRRNSAANSLGLLPVRGGTGNALNVKGKIMPLETHLEGIARAGLQYQKDQAAAREAEREHQEKARIEAEQNSPEALWARDIAKIQATQAEAIAKQEAQRIANLDAQARAKAEREAEIRLLGRAIAAELAPDFRALTTEIRALVVQLKDGQAAEKET